MNRGDAVLTKHGAQLLVTGVPVRLESELKDRVVPLAGAGELVFGLSVRATVVDQAGGAVVDVQTELWRRRRAVSDV